MIASSAQLAIGFALLVVAADQLVLGAARAALALRISAVVVGAVIIGFGTSAPELVVTVLAGLEGAADVAAGNLVGSNLANVAVVAAIAALITPLYISSSALRRELPLATGGVLALALALQGGLSRVEGMILLALFALAAAWILRSSRDEDDVLGPEAEEVTEAGRGLRGELVRLGLGLAGTIGGAQLVVVSSQDIATELGVAQGFVGLTLVALGTSLPELVTAVQAARRGYADLIVGNILGSNLFNSLLAGGILALVSPGPFEDPDLTGLAAAAMLVIALVWAVLIGTGRRLVRWEAAVMIAAYLALLPLLYR